MTRLLHSGPATKVRVNLPKVVNLDQVLEEMEEKKEEGARQEEQQALVHHGRHQLEMGLCFAAACLAGLSKVLTLE